MALTRNQMIKTLERHGVSFATGFSYRTDEELERAAAEWFARGKPTNVCIDINNLPGDKTEIVITPRS